MEMGPHTVREKLCRFLDNNAFINKIMAIFMSFINNIILLDEIENRTTEISFFALIGFKSKATVCVCAY